MSMTFKNRARRESTGEHRDKTLSVIIITKDEEDRIEGCLESVYGWADEIIVLDSGSTDRTVALSKKYTDKVFVADWPGYGPQKQRALEKATGEWVLSVDADEQVTPELRAEIDKRLNGSPKEIGFRIPWADYIFGKRLDHGRSRRANLRLFKREGALYSDAIVHQKVILPDGKIDELNACLLHFTYRNMSHAMYKFSQYSWEWAKQRHASGKRSGLTKALFHSCWMFFSIYFIKLGFLDGRRGLLMAILFWQYTFNKYAALWAMEISGDQNG